MSDIVYRTNNPDAWGAGQGSDLAAAQIDMNFWILFTAILALQDHALTDQNQIDSFNVVGDQLYIVMMNHEVFGPYTLPTAQWNFRGAWTADTAYSMMDVITNDGSVYLVIWDHTSAATFDPNANDGDGHDFYALLLTQPEDELPDGGEVGQVLTVIDAGSPEGTPITDWQYPTKEISHTWYGFFTGDAGDIFSQYVAAQTFTLPAGLTGSQVGVLVGPETTQTFTIYKNFTVIGSIELAPSPAVSFAFDDAVTFNPGDILRIVNPSSPIDSSMANVSITLLANLT